MQVQVLPALREWGSLKERARKNGHVRDRNGKLFSSGNGEDAGSNPAVQSAWDIIGNKRIWGEKIDIGAFEYITKE